MEKLVKRKHADSKGNAQLKPRKRKQQDQIAYNYKLHGFHTNSTFNLNLLGKYNEVRNKTQQL